MIGLFLEMGTGYKRIKKSTTLDISFNSETETYDFIADKNPTESLKSYSPQISQDLTMVKGEDDFEYIYEKMMKSVPNNEEVNTKALIAFMFDGDKTKGYRAWEVDAKLIFDTLSGVDSKINFNINFASDIRVGIAKVADGTVTFTEGTSEV
nr:MAG TPA: hypothetical protein [Caudoviricetes sp.]